MQVSTSPLPRTPGQGYPAPYLRQKRRLSLAGRCGGRWRTIHPYPQAVPDPWSCPAVSSFSQRLEPFRQRSWDLLFPALASGPYPGRLRWTGVSPAKPPARNGAGLPSNAKIQGDRLRSGLEVLQEKHQSIGDVRGMGLMQALEIVDPNSSDGKAPDAEKMSLLLDKTKDLGLLVGKGGLYANVIRISPPMIADASDVDRALDILDQAFAAVG